MANAPTLSLFMLNGLARLMTEMVTFRAYTAGMSPLHLTVPTGDDECMRHLHKALNRYFPAFRYQVPEEWYKDLWADFRAAMEDSSQYGEEVFVDLARFDTDSSRFFVRVWEA